MLKYVKYDSGLANNAIKIEFLWSKNKFFGQGTTYVVENSYLGIKKMPGSYKY